MQQAVQHAPYYPESHNLNGLVCEARLDYQSAIAAYRLAQCALKVACDSKEVLKSHHADISINLARALCQVSCGLVDTLPSVSGHKADLHGYVIHAFMHWNKIEVTSIFECCCYPLLWEVHISREAAIASILLVREFKVYKYYVPYKGSITDASSVQAGYALDAAHECEKLEKDGMSYFYL